MEKMVLLDVKISGIGTVEGLIVFLQIKDLKTFETTLKRCLTSNLQK